MGGNKWSAFLYNLCRTRKPCYKAKTYLGTNQNPFFIKLCILLRQCKVFSLRDCDYVIMWKHFILDSGYVGFMDKSCSSWTGRPRKTLRWVYTQTWSWLMHNSHPDRSKTIPPGINSSCLRFDERAHWISVYGFFCYMYM